MNAHMNATVTHARAHGRRPALLIVGCGDIGRRVARLLVGRWRVIALTTRATHADALRALGVVPLIGDLDQPATLQRLSGLADAVLHLAPPEAGSDVDRRTANLLRALARRGRVQRIVYVSTSGVYGDCAGAWVDETRTPQPSTGRAARRADAELRLRAHGRAFGVGATVLRVPGIYARDRGEPASTRGARGLPVLDDADDVYTNHIHADDLARLCIAALFRGKPQRVINISDDSALKMGAYFDLAADLAHVARPPRIARAQGPAHLSPMQLSFMGESRRLVNTRMKQELRVALRYPVVEDGLRAT